VTSCELENQGSGLPSSQPRTQVSHALVLHACFAVVMASTLAMVGLLRVIQWLNVPVEVAVVLRLLEYCVLFADSSLFLVYLVSGLWKSVKEISK